MSSIEQRQSASFIVTEPSRTPPPGLLPGYAAMVPVVAGALGAFGLPRPCDAVALDFVATWGAAVLIFLAGVHRGLSFRTPGGGTAAQIVTMFSLFWLGIAAFHALMPLPFAVLLAILLPGTLILAIFDPIAARRGEAPPFVARLRRVQMLVPSSSLALMQWPVSR